MLFVFVVILHLVQHSVLIFSIANNSNTAIESSSQLGSWYKHPQYAFGTNEAQSFLAGSFKFKLDEIEVYEKE